VPGGIVGLLLPSYIVGEESSPDVGKALFLRLLLIEAIVSTALCIPLFIFMREKPPTAPSSSATIKRESFKNGIKLLFRNKSFLWLLGQQACVLGAINSLLTTMQSVIEPFGFTQVQSATLGTVVQISIVSGCLILGYLVEKTKKFKLGIVMSSVIGLSFFGVFTAVLYTHNFIALAAVLAVLAFCLAPSGPIALEFACELTFPVGEALAGGVILSLMQIICPAQTFAMGAIMDRENKTQGALFSIIMLICFMAMGLVCSFGIKQNFKRSAHDNQHHDNAVAAMKNAAQNNPETPMPLVGGPDSSPTPNNS